MSAQKPQTTISKHIKRSEIDGFDKLQALALNLLWAWNHYGDKVWKELDKDLWELTHNPLIIIHTVSSELLQNKLSDPIFRKIVDDLFEANKLKTEGPKWFQNNYPDTPLSCVAYFCMEFMLSEALPIYSGGLGNVAGDQLKTASDLGVPVVAIGLLYQQGYFRQMIDRDGVQQAFYPFNNPGQLPIKPLRLPNGEWLRLEIPLPGWSVWLRTWEVQVGRARLYLLDSNDAANFPPHRSITSELYGGGPEMRFKQELILGIGGYRLLEALGIKPEVCHLNECHAAFVVLERAALYMKENKVNFEEALSITRAGNLFTTHTAVAAGFDRFPPSMVEQYLSTYAREQLGISFQELLALGRINPSDTQEEFNMAYLAIRGSGAINGVSRLHAKVSRQLFSSLFPRWTEDEVPVGYVTNGVHMPSWDSSFSDNLWTTACGKNRWQNTECKLENDIQCLPEDKIWQMKNDGRNALVEFTRARTIRHLSAIGASLLEIENAKTLFDPNTLTMGFARRFATYKRPDMLLHDPERLLRILNHPDRPVQLIIAGKAHPADEPGKALIQRWIQFIKRPEAAGKVIFLSDYDMSLTEKLVQGVDIWINTPKRPWEACGTSGMKVLVNGGLNVSELDGWWAEAYEPDIGWALGDGKEHDSDPAWDAVEAEELYNILETEVIPLYYTRAQNGLPTAWINRIRESMSRLTPKFSAARAVKDYTEHYYIELATKYKERSSDKKALKTFSEWKHALENKWSSIRFLDLNVMSTEGNHNFDVTVNLDGLDYRYIEVELYADAQNGTTPLCEKMKCVGPLKDAVNAYAFHLTIPATRPAADYTPRIIPFRANVSIPLEASEILWQK